MSDDVLLEEVRKIRELLERLEHGILQGGMFAIRILERISGRP